MPTKIFLILICFTPFGTRLKAQFSLPKLITLAEKNAPQAKLLPIINESEAIQLSALNKNLLPQTMLGGQASWQSAVTSFPIKLPNIEVPIIPKDQYKFTLDINQTIWDGGQLKSQKLLTTANANAETKSVESTLYQIKEQVANLYFVAILSEKQLQSTEITKNELESNLKRLNANVQNGTATKSNALAFEAKLIEIRQIQREIISKKLAALGSLSILTGLELNENTVLEPEFGAISDKNSLEINRPELNYFEAQKMAINANKEVANARYRPKLNLFGTGGYGRPGLNFLLPDFSAYFIGGLSLKIPISQLYTRTKEADFQLIDLNKLKIDKQKESFLQQINMKTASLKEEAAKLEYQIIEDKKLIEIRDQMKNSAQNRLNNGIITVSEYLGELDNELLAKQNMILHQIQLMQVFNNLNLVRGN